MSPITVQTVARLKLTLKNSSNQRKSTCLSASKSSVESVNGVERFTLIEWLEGRPSKYILLLPLKYRCNNCGKIEKAEELRLYDISRTKDFEAYSAGYRRPQVMPRDTLLCHDCQIIWHQWLKRSRSERIGKRLMSVLRNSLVPKFLENRHYGDVK